MLKTRKLNALIALEVILSMTLYYFVLIGFTAVTYAIDLVQTNNHNIDFVAYFLNENGEKTNSKENIISEREYLYVDIMVKNEGYFNGYINLNNNNFNIVQDIQSENIEEISGNTVKLKQMNSGSTQTIKLLIEPVKDDLINKSSFNANTEIVLSGNYVNSKNIETEKDSEITGTTEVNMNWKSSEEISSELEGTVLTNSIFDINGNHKRVVQLLINSKVKNDEYPIKNTTIKVEGLKNAEQVKVFARNTDATNSQFVFTESNYEYDKTNDRVIINVDNNNEDTISWKKANADTFVVTYILDKDEEVSNQNIVVNGSLLTYDQKTLEANANVIVNEEKDGIVTSDLIVKENAIYKGKIYTGEERAYQTETKIYMNYSDLTDKVIVNEKSSKFIHNETEYDSNNVYKATSISKNNFNKILGENGYITIKDENGTIIGNINNTIDTDENGNIILNYNTEVKGLIIETSKPINEGTLDLIHTKVIINSNLTREAINSLTGVKENSEVKYNEKDVMSTNSRIIELKNTSSKAKLEVEPTKLTSTQKNENVKMTVILENSNEARDLYQNPVIKLKLPSQVKNASAKCKAMYKNGLEISNAKIYKENENYILEIGLQGTQTSYNTGIVDGTSIIIYADLEIDENAENCNEEIVLNYTNELATSFEDNGEEKVGIEIEGIPEEIKTKLEEQKAKALEAQGKFNVSFKGYVGDQELSSEDTVYTGEIIRYEIVLENNTNTDIDNVNLQALVPEGTTLIECVTDEFLEDKYIEKQIENNTINKTIEKINHSYDNKLVWQYEVRVNEDTNVSSIINKLKVDYNNSSINKEIVNTLEKENVSIEVLMQKRHSSLVNDGEIYAYYINIKNITDKDLKNVPIRINTNSAYKIENILDSNTIEKVTDTNQFLVNLSAGETKKYYIEVTVNRENQNYATLYAIANNRTKSNYCSEKIQTLSLNSNLDSDKKNQKVTGSEDIVYKLVVENNGDVAQNGLSIKQLISNYCDVEKVSLNGEELEFNKTYYNQIENEEEKDYYYIEYNLLKEFAPGEKCIINIYTKVKDIEFDNDINISTFAKINGVKTNTIAHILTNDKDESEDDDYYYTDDEYVVDPTMSEKREVEKIYEEDEEDTENNNEDNKENTDTTANKDNNNSSNNNQSTQESKYSISGRVWLDENENGQRDLNEKDLNDVQITLLNIDTKNTKKISNTSSYKFTNLEKGRYIAIFEYDTNKYNLTKYQAENVSKDLNSDVEKSKINYEGKEQLLAITDILNITNENITNIDLGLVNSKTFDLELSKTISKITVSNNEGKVTKEYSDSQLAKIEIGAKYLKNSTVVIEYSIKVKNTGELAGYAKQIVDYKPTDLKFNSSLNSEWYQSGEVLYSTALEKIKIEPGETKELKLILTKEMTESNTGLTNNIAEINKSISINNTDDKDSTYGNKKTGEDDLGQANVIIGVKTGAAISYIFSVLILFALVTIGAVVINKKIQKIYD